MLKFNGTEIKKIVKDSTEIKELKYNGVTVFTSTLPAINLYEFIQNNPDKITSTYTSEGSYAQGNVSLSLWYVDINFVNGTDDFYREACYDLSYLVNLGYNTIKVTLRCDSLGPNDCDPYIQYGEGSIGSWDLYEGGSGTWYKDLTAASPYIKASIDGAYGDWAVFVEEIIIMQK